MNKVRVQSFVLQTAREPNQVLNREGIDRHIAIEYGDLETHSVANDGLEANNLGVRNCFLNSISKSSDELLLDFDTLRRGQSTIFFKLIGHEFLRNLLKF